MKRVFFFFGKSAHVPIVKRNETFVARLACQRCLKLFIVETGRRLADGFGKHLRSVEGFKQNPRDQGGWCGFPVAEHFNLPEHSQAHDMRVSG